MTDPRLEYLLEKYLAKTCTEMEKRELAEMILITENETGVHAFLETSWDTVKIDEDMSGQKADQLINSILRQGGKKDAAIVLRMFSWKKVAVAASILIAVATIGYFIIPKPNNHSEVVSATSIDVAPPKSTKATITLVDGRKISLDSLTTITQGEVTAVKNSKGEIVYQSTTNKQQSSIQYNTLSNPRGSQIATMTLADGSKIWLNTGSSITYPIAFTGNERKVSITGEAYFEVAHDKAKPFFVSKGDVSVQVLGTHFNINAYDDEADIRVTLLEGSVKVNGNADSKIIKPGEQAVLTHNTESITLNSPDLKAVMAWKNGFFQFDRAGLQQVLRQITRWYDVDVVYEGKIPEREFLGELERDLNLSQVLKLLEKNKVHFSIEGKKIIVKP